MLRLINIQHFVYATATDLNFNDLSSTSYVRCDVVDVDNQCTLGSIMFHPGSSAMHLLFAESDELTKLTTITGDAEHNLRNYFNDNCHTD